LFAGANTIAIGNGSDDLWEIIQFRDAVLVAPNTYDLRVRLRGQLGSDGIAPGFWPTGSQIVVLNTALRQLGLAESQRGLSLDFRIGALSRGPEDASTTARTLSFDGNGLRPYAVAHLRHSARIDGADSFSWVRRTRLGGDSWQSIEVPLSEEVEQYTVEVVKNGSIMRTSITTQAQWDYSAAMKAADGVTKPYFLRVAQISLSYGPGPARELAIFDEG
jgi:hypothetical protein